MFNEESEILYFVELKTDSSSFKLSQHLIYEDIVKKISLGRGAGELYDFLGELKSAKYQNYKAYVVDTNISRDIWPKIESAKLIYIAPKKLAKEKEKVNPRRGEEGQQAISEATFICFSDLCETIDHKYNNEWQIITKHLKRLDDN